MSVETRPPASQEPLRLTPSLVGRPWGGGRFGSVDDEPVGEVWVSGDEATLPDGRTLAEAAVAATLPLVKLLDVHGTLSVQVHPDDATAVALRGPGSVGKHECWVVLEAPEGATVAIGLEPAASVEDLFSGDEDRVVAALRHRSVAVGSILDIPPGTVHAPAGGLVLYEIQQRSDLTFRIWDWGRPRPIHLEESRRCLRPASDPMVAALPRATGVEVVSDPSAPFRLLSCRPGGATVSVDVVTDRPGVLSVLDGPLRLDSVEGSLEPGSHWLLPAGSWGLRGPGSALIATEGRQGAPGAASGAHPADPPG
jgi:mannose-6-phosphate isomerase